MPTVHAPCVPCRLTDTGQGLRAVPPAYHPGVHPLTAPSGISRTTSRADPAPSVAVATASPARPVVPCHGHGPLRRPAVFISQVTVRLTSESETIPTSLP